MKIVDNIKGGLIVIHDWPRKDRIDYKGFDGESIWPGAQLQITKSDVIRQISRIEDKIMVKNGFAQLDNLTEVLKYKENLHEESRLLYLRLIDFNFFESKFFENKFSFLGFDYGNYISESNYYSLIYHEIIGGLRGGLREEFNNYVPYLNKNLLFSSLVHLPELEKTTIELRAGGEYLEDEIKGEEFQPIAVYAYIESN